MGARSRLRTPLGRAAACALLGLLAAGAARGAGLRVTIDREEATIEDRLLLTVTVEGSTTARPRLPELPDFDVQGRGQSTQVSFINGRPSTSVEYTFVLTPRRTGTFQIGAASVEIDGRTHQSRPFVVRIVGAEARPRESRDLFLTAEVSTDEPYLGQQVVFTWRLFRRVRIADARLEPLEFDGFLVEDLGEVREFETTVNGVPYLVSEIRKALFPQEEGVLTIPPSRLTCEVAVRAPRRSGSLFDDMFGRVQTESKVLKSGAIELTVRPRPAAPEGFSGLVGSFRLEAAVSQRQLQVGESTTLRVTVKGTGNAQMIAEPKLPELPSFKIYDDKPTASVDRGGKALSGAKTFSKALVPLEPGALIVPPLSLVYFDPENGSYRTARTEPISLTVAPGALEEDVGLVALHDPSAGKVPVRILADDVLPIYKGVDVVARVPGRRGGLLLAGGLALPPLIFFGTLAARRRQRRFELDRGLRRRRGALRRARRGLAKLTADASNGGAEGATAGQRASRCLREYIGDKLDLEGSALTPVEAAESLRGVGVEAGLVEEVRRLLERLEAAQFGAARVEPQALGDEIRPLLDRLEKALPR